MHFRIILIWWGRLAFINLKIDLGSLALSPAHVGDSQEVTLLFLAGPRGPGRVLTTKCEGQQRKAGRGHRLISFSLPLPPLLSPLFSWLIFKPSASSKMRTFSKDYVKVSNQLKNLCSVSV